MCERLANRGRRFFLMGALALPVAHKIAQVAEKLIVPAPQQVITLRYSEYEFRWVAAVNEKDDYVQLPWSSEFAVAT